jgi:hypothetical protein
MRFMQPPRRRPGLRGGLPDAGAALHGTAELEARAQKRQRLALSGPPTALPVRRMNYASCSRQARSISSARIFTPGFDFFRVRHIVHAHALVRVRPRLIQPGKK